MLGPTAPARWRRVSLALAALLCALACRPEPADCLARATRRPTPPAASSAGASGRSWYVSTAGSNADGASWATAWRELDQIDWGRIRPGDTILLDGGAAEMIYQTPLIVRASGTPRAPLTIRRAAEPGRNGRVVLFGGRATPLPYYGQPRGEYAPPAVERRYGLEVGTDQVAGGTAISDVVVDGGGWGGIRVHGHREAGVKLWAENRRVTLRNLEVDDNGAGFPDPDTGGATWYPDQPGIVLAGEGVVLERLDVHDNGQDAIVSSGSTGSSFRDVIVRGSWLHQTRTRPDGMIWNQGERSHPDGIQVFSGHEQSGLTVEGSVVGPLLMHGLILGDAGSGDDPDQDWAVVHDLTVRDSLLYGNWNSNIHSGDTDLVPGRPRPRGWRIDRVTSDLAAPGRDLRSPSGSPWNTHVDFVFAGEGAELTVTDSLFSGGWGARVPAGGCYRGNVQTGERMVAAGADGSAGGVLGPALDPRYADTSAPGSKSARADFALAAGSPAAGKGASPTSAARLIAGDLPRSPSPGGG